jgi:hypothetical protein
MGAHTNEVVDCLALNSHTRFSCRKFCGKLNPPSVLLPDGESQIWEKSKVIEDEDKQLVEAILTRYGFDEVTTGETTCANPYGTFEGIHAVDYHSSTIRSAHL